MLESRLAAGAVSSQSQGGATLGTALQPSTATAWLSRLATSRSVTHRVEVVGLVRVDELVRAQGTERVAGRAQEDDGVVVRRDSERVGECDEGGDARGVVAGALGGQRRGCPGWRPA